MHPARILILLLVAFSSLAPAASASVGSIDPVLWSGIIQTPAGRPAPGATVIAYARPPAERLRAGDPLPVIATTITNGSGEFTLRAQPSAMTSAAADEAGWTTVMVTALSRDGMTLAVDSVAWVPSSGAKDLSATGTGAAGRWVTSPTDRFATKTYRTEALAETEAATRAERPHVLVLSTERPAAAPATRTFVAKREGHAPASNCMLNDSQDLGVHKTSVGELHLNANWGGEFTYNTSRSTTFQIGLSRDGSPFRVGGSVTVSRDAKSGGVLKNSHTMRTFNYRADMLYKRFKWTCGWEYQYYFAETIEPVLWAGGMHQEASDAMPPCWNDKYAQIVESDRFFQRGEGSGTSLEGAIDVAGFRGSVLTATSTKVVQKWHNYANRGRNLCGSTDYPTAITRVMTWG